MIDQANSILAAILALATIAGFLVGIGKLIACISALKEAVTAATAALTEVTRTQGEHATKLAVHATKHETHEKNIGDLWNKVNRVSESGQFEPVKKR